MDLSWKIIYIMDAYDDLEKDKEKGNYNPFAGMSKSADFEEKVQGASLHDDCRKCGCI